MSGRNGKSESSIGIQQLHLISAHGPEQECSSIVGYEGRQKDLENMWRGSWAEVGNAGLAETMRRPMRPSISAVL